MSVDLGRALRLALEADKTIEVGSWASRLARKAVAGVAARDPVLALQASQWARCAWADGHEWPPEPTCGCGKLAIVRGVSLDAFKSITYLCTDHDSGAEDLRARGWRREALDQRAAVCQRCGAKKGAPNLLDLVREARGR